MKKRNREQQSGTRARSEKRDASNKPNEKSCKTLENEQIKENYPDCLNAQLILKNIHPDLRSQFLAKCAKEGATFVGKLRYFMWACPNGKIDDAKANVVMESITNPKAFAPVPKELPHVLVMNEIPAKLHREFKNWCLLRGYTISGKLRQLMIAYLNGVIE